MYDSYSKAVDYFNHDRLDYAENLLTDLLNENKYDDKILNFLGMIKMVLKDYSKAIEYFKKSIDMNNNDYNSHYNLALCYQHLKDNESALTEYEKSLELKPHNIDALNNTGIVFSALGKYPQAEKCYELGLELEPRSQKLLVNLANLKLHNQKFEEAEKIYISILEDDANKEINYYNLGNCYLEAEQYDKAVKVYEQALDLNPEYFPAFNNLGLALRKVGLYEKAIHIYLRALDSSEDKASIYFNLAKCYEDQKDFENAIKYFKQAVQLNPELKGSYVNIGDILWKLGRIEEAKNYYRLVSTNDAARGIYYTNHSLKMIAEREFDKAKRYLNIASQIVDDNAEIHYNKSHVYLLTGEFEQGWREYEWRLKRDDFPARKLSKPVLNTKDISGKKILVYDEQGIGDSIQFVRYLKLLKKMDATIIYECYDLVHDLYKDFDCVDTFLEHSNDEPNIDYDYQISLLSLPYYFNTRIETIPGAIPYIFAEDKLIEKWKERTTSNRKIKAGIVWAGRPTHKNDKFRSCELKKFSNLFSNEDVEFYSLQKGDAVNQITTFNNRVINLSRDINSLSDTAAIIENLDIVITVDTSVAHLAGAMGKEVWVLIAYIPDWRWLIDRDDTPWYPSMRLFRQDKKNDWTGLFNKVEKELADKVRTFKTSQKIDKSSKKKNYESADEIFLGLANGDNFGWGVCSKHLNKELSQSIKIKNLDSQKEILKNGFVNGTVLHALTDQNFKSLYKVRGTKNFGYAFFENELNENSVKNSKNYNLILGGSRWNMEKMREKGIKNSDYLIQGIDPKIFNYIDEETNENRFVIFSGGKFELRKGQDLVLRALKIIQQKYTDIILVNAWYNFWPQIMSQMEISKYIQYGRFGNNWEEIMLNLYRINNMDVNRIITLPLIKNELMRDVYAKTDLGLFPNRCEGGTNLVLMEYMACGKPVVASYNTGHKDILTLDNSIMLRRMSDFVIENNNTNFNAIWQEPNLDEIVSSLEYAYFHREEIKQIGKRAAKDMQKYTWTVTAENLLKKISHY